MKKGCVPIFKRKKVLLVTPPYHCGVVESAGRWPNLGFLYIAGELLKNGFDVEIYDAMARFDTWDDIEERLAGTRADFVGSTAYTATVNDAVALLKLAKRLHPGTITLLGGIHPTFCYSEVLEDPENAVDFCIIGEGEKTIVELLSAIRAGGAVSKVKGIAYLENAHAVKTGERPLIEDLDSLSPAWHVPDWNEYPLYFIDDSRVAIVSSSRGCLNKCSFCSQQKFWNNTYRERDPDSFVSEIELLASAYRINVFFIADEYPTKSGTRWERILDLLIEKDLGVHILLETCVGDIVRDKDLLWKYRKAGIFFVYTGVEAGEKSRLEQFRKNIEFETSKEAVRLIKDNGIIAESSLILGMPDETDESVKQTLELAKEYNPDFMHFLLIAPWPYADIYKELDPFIEVRDYSKYNLVYPVVKPVAMTRDELFAHVLKCYKEYYMWKVNEWQLLEPGLKRDSIFKGIKAIMENSFLKDHMGKPGAGIKGAPSAVREMLGVGFDAL